MTECDTQVSVPLRVLVVDDEPTIRKLIAVALQKAGCQCDVAEDGVEGSEKAIATRYDAVVTDLNMPRKHGFAFARSLLKANPRPVIMILTGDVDRAIAEDLVAQGVDDVQYKPIKCDELASTLLALATRRQSHADSDCHPPRECLQ